ncbi:hypothetical protein F4692_003229 [Nocardioides cavernae]|uniref:MFS transporter n=1 Tax=Nocardioides cavernae TaxID=1921566 RepID=A0A7Y9KSZ5_9ACTN|nr:hypothetical protein [Nocardioides cavernae]
MPRSDLQPAHARIDGADAVASTTGPALGGLLVSAVGAPLAVVLDSLTYLWSAFALSRIDHEEPPPRTGLTARGLQSDIADGVRWAVWFVAVGVFATVTVGLALTPFRDARAPA